MTAGVDEEKGKTQEDEERRRQSPPELITLANSLNPPSGKPMTMYARKARCPIHGAQEGVETTWTAPRGIDPNLREFVCPIGHAFYAKMRPLTEKGKSKRTRGI